MKLLSRLVGLALFSAMTACAPMAAERASAPVPLPAPVAAPAETRRPVTILVSIDGFRYDYLARGITPNLSRLAAQGVSAPMHPSFPSKTFPNHWAIVTGERPDDSGIVANRMEDATRPGEVFTMATDDPFWWNEAEPIWVTAEKAGIRTASAFWPGANVAWGGTRASAWPNRTTGGTRPSDWLPYSEAFTGAQRIDMVIDWLRRPAATRPAFLTLYFDTVDTAGHEYGPDAPETDAAIRDVDALIGKLEHDLDVLGQPADLVILSDHGMAATSSDRTIALDRIADPADYRIIESGPFASLAPVPGHEAALAKALSVSREHMQCWPKAKIPAHFHYGANARVAPWFCLAEDGWLISPTAPAGASHGGTHGYDNMAPDMAALFIADGPDIRAHVPVRADFTNVDVYPMLLRLLKLPLRPTDGDPAVLDALVKAP